jgi:hypothetical protein
MHYPRPSSLTLEAPLTMRTEHRLALLIDEIGKIQSIPKMRFFIENQLG